MRLSSRRTDDADLIRARLRVLLDEGSRAAGWLPDDLDEEGPDPARPAGVAGGRTRVDDEAERDDAGGGEVGDRTGLPGGFGRHRAPGAAVRLDPGRRGAWALWLAGLLGALLLAGWTWLDRPRVEPAVGAPVGVTSAPATDAPATPSVGTAAGTSSTVTVSVVGLVVRPGLVVLPAGARVADALQAAGGPLPEADPASVNLAEVVADGQQIAVGTAGSGSAAPAGATPPGGARVSLNAATAAELDALPGIGPVLAQRIVGHREEHGPFTTVEQLDDVPGIGPATYDELAGLVTV